MIILTGKAVCVGCRETYNIQDSDAWSPTLYCTGECEAVDEMDETEAEESCDD